MDNKEAKQETQITGVVYEDKKINEVLSLLNTLSVTGVNQAKALSSIFDILVKPLPINNNIENK